MSEIKENKQTTAKTTRGATKKPLPEMMNCIGSSIAMAMASVALLAITCSSPSSTGGTGGTDSGTGGTGGTDSGTGGNRQDPNGDFDRDGVINSMDIDNNNDGLIEISSLEMLYNIRYNLAGTSYKTSMTNTGTTRGAPTSRTADCTTATDDKYLCGYELTKNLDFDVDDDGTTFVAASAGACDLTITIRSGRLDYSGCTLDADDNNATYFNTTAEPATGNFARGWTPIGEGSSEATRFTGIFDGKGFTISNLSLKIYSGSNIFAGLFGRVSTGIIRNIGLIDGITITSNGTNENFSGRLVGLMSSTATIMNSFATGLVAVISNTASNTRSTAGGLVGLNFGTIMNSFSNSSVSVITSMSDASNSPTAGGLVGILEDRGNITNSYATGSVVASWGAGGARTFYVGGLVGTSFTGNITNSYATASVLVNSKAGSLVGPVFGLGTCTDKCYRNSAITPTIDPPLSTPNTEGTAVPLSSFQSLDWYNANDTWNTTDPNTAWDFTTIWNPPAAGTNGGLPTLR